MLNFSFAEWISKFEEGRLPQSNVSFNPVSQPFDDYETAKSMAIENEPKFKAYLTQVLNKGANGKGEIKTNIKTEKSTIDKLERGKSIKNVTDILRATIIVDGNEKDLKKVASSLFSFPEYPVVLL